MGRRFVFERKVGLEISIFLGFFAGYVVGNVFSRLITFRTQRQAITMAQIQSLRLMSNSVVHYGTLRQWHDNVAIGMDDIKRKIVEKVTAGIKTDSGVISFSDAEVQELKDFWKSDYEQDLKGVWNTFEWDFNKFKNASVALIAESSSEYGKPPYENWKEAMQWLAMFELTLMQKEKERQKSEEEKNEA